jgi:hypothetical protein
MTPRALLLTIMLDEDGDHSDHPSDHLHGLATTCAFLKHAFIPESRKAP